MRRMMLMVLLLLVTAATLNAQVPGAAAGAAQETFTIFAESQGRLRLNDHNANAIVFTVTKADGKPADKKTLVVTRVRGDADLYDLVKGTASAGATVELETDPEGKARLSIHMKAKPELRLNAMVKNSKGETKEVDVTAASGGPRTCPDEKDCRDETALTFYSGMVFDSFASESYNATFNPGETGEIKEKPVFGVDFDHLISGAPGKSRLWIYGETLHGTRSLEVDCSKGNPKTDSTAPPTSTTPDPNDDNPCNDTTDALNTQDFVGILRNAESLEAYAGVRYEPNYNWVTDRSVFYYKLQFGFMTVAGDGGDVIDNHHLGAGILKTKGKFRGSYFEAGLGKTDLFKSRRNARLKFDGYVSYSMKGDEEEAFITPFLQMTIDADGVGGADSIQIYAGLNFAFDLLRISADNN